MYAQCKERTQNSRAECTHFKTLQHCLQCLRVISWPYRVCYCLMASFRNSHQHKVQIHFPSVALSGRLKDKTPLSVSACAHIAYEKIKHKATSRHHSNQEWMQLLNLTGTGSASPWSPLLLFQGALGYRPSQQQYVPSEASALSFLIQSFFNPLTPWYLWPPSEQCSIVHLFQAHKHP